MKNSGTITNISGALLNAQKAFGSAKKGSANPFFKSKYADLNAILEACKDSLNDNGITILQPHFSDERGDFVETVLMHSSGEWISSETRLEVAKKNDPQALGSAISYARRYGLQSFISLPAEDDDANSNYDRKPDVKSTPATTSSFKKAASVSTETKETVATTSTTTGSEGNGWQ